MRPYPVHHLLKNVDAVPCDGKDDPGGGIYSTNPLTENIRNKKITG
jgi:hypothetical protein